MDAVANKAGVSKATVYGHFGSKEGLFEAVVGGRRREILAAVRAAFDGYGNDPALDLEAFAVAFQTHIMVPEARCWDRLVMAEADRHPELAQGMFAAGPAVILELIAGYMARQAAAGRLAVPDPAVAAEHFLGLVIGLDLVRGLLASLPRRTDRQVRDRAKAAVQTFLMAHRIRTEGAN